MEPSPDVLRAIVASVADAVYVVDEEGRVLFVNPAAVGLLGYDEEGELLDRPSHALIHFKRPDGSPFPESECVLLRPRRTGEEVHVEEDWFVRRDGSMVPVSYSSAPLSIGKTRGAVVVFRDITEQQRLARLARQRDAEEARATDLAAARRRLAEAVDAARRGIERDLHDGAQQSFAAVAVQLALARELLRTDPSQAGRLLEQSIESQRAALDELRELARGIHPTILRDNGLAAALRTLSRRSSVPVRLDVQEIGRVDQIRESTVYFLVAEALTNVARHAPSSSVEVTLQLDDDTITVGVRDNGPGGVDELRGSGLQGLRDRIEAIGGTLDVSSPAGGGTALVASLPGGTSRRLESARASA